jgi:hypothetical protein
LDSVDIYRNTIQNFIPSNHIIYLIIALALLTIHIIIMVWGFILFVRIAKRAIKVLEIYLHEKQNSKNNT